VAWGGLLLGFLVSALYIPGLINPAHGPRWALILGIIPWLLKPQAGSPAHWFGAAFLTWSAITIIWSPAVLDGIHQAFILAAWAALFLYGAQAESLRPFYIGAGIGIGLSSILAVMQAMGIEPLPYVFPFPRGLFVNGNYLAEAAALVLVAAVSERLWWLIPALLPALFLPRAKGALLAAGAGLAAWLWNRSRVAAIALVAFSCAAVVAIIVTAPETNDAEGERWLIWGSTFNGITWLGHGLGSFRTVFPAFDLRELPTGTPEYAHNEALQIAFDQGLIGLFLALVFVITLAGRLDTSRLILIALAVEAAFAFPLHMPTTAAIGFLAAGYACRRGALFLGFEPFGRKGVYARQSAFGVKDLSIRAPLPGNHDEG